MNNNTSSPDPPAVYPLMLEEYVVSSSPAVMHRLSSSMSAQENEARHTGVVAARRFSHPSQTSEEKCPVLLYSPLAHPLLPYTRENLEASRNLALSSWSHRDGKMACSSAAKKYIREHSPSGEAANAMEQLNNAPKGERKELKKQIGIYGQRKATELNETAPDPFEQRRAKSRYNVPDNAQGSSTGGTSQDVRFALYIPPSNSLPSTSSKPSPSQQVAGGRASRKSRSRKDPVSSGRVGRRTTKASVPSAGSEPGFLGKDTPHRSSAPGPPHPQAGAGLPFPVQGRDVPSPSPVPALDTSLHTPYFGGQCTPSGQQQFWADYSTIGFGGSGSDLGSPSYHRSGSSVPSSSSRVPHSRRDTSASSLNGGPWIFLEHSAARIGHTPHYVEYAQESFMPPTSTTSHRSGTPHQVHESNHLATDPNYDAMFPGQSYFDYTETYFPERTADYFLPEVESSAQGSYMHSTMPQGHFHGDQSTSIPSIHPTPSAYRSRHIHSHQQIEDSTPGPSLLPPNWTLSHGLSGAFPRMPMVTLSDRDASVSTGLPQQTSVLPNLFPSTPYSEGTGLFQGKYDPGQQGGWSWGDDTHE
ncbi:hypothetical protein NMY22_g7638 [Coprinellus aureogranulatus]|nr:hypothetical protein NMY22_g7638 [Coprinellus aureogranulatus]